MDFFRGLVEKIKDEDTSMAVDGKGSAEFSGWIDTGCYMMNALCSGSIFGGMPNNKVLTLAGESSTGKTFISLGIVKQFLDKHPNGGVVYFDTESAITNKMMIDRNIDPKRIIRSEPSTIEDFRNKAVRILTAYEEHDKRPPMMFVLDSLSVLSSNKELKDAAEEKDVKDMTKAGLIKGVFRVLRLRLARLGIPMICTSHIYANVGGYGPIQQMSSGSGPRYSSDAIAWLKKRSEKQGEKEEAEVIGSLITVSMFKSRLTKEGQKVEMKVSFETGLDRWHGLLEFGERAGVFTRKGNYYNMKEGKFFAKQIYKDPERFFTQDVLEQLDQAAKETFQYGGIRELQALEDDEEEGELAEA